MWDRDPQRRDHRRDRQRAHLPRGTTAASDLASVWLDVEPSEVEVDVTIEAPGKIVELITESQNAAAEAEAAIARVDQLRREAARALRAEGYPFEAAGAILGVTYQRVQQLAGSHLGSRDIEPGWITCSSASSRTVASAFACLDAALGSWARSGGDPTLAEYLDTTTNMIRIQE